MSRRRLRRTIQESNIQDKDKPFSVPLFSGIGNIIQSLPFAFEMKRRYGKVTAFHQAMGFPETRFLINDIFDRIYARRTRVPDKYRFASVPRRRSFSEYKSWFTDNNEPLPKKFRVDFIGFQEVTMKHKVVIWPECQSNWICKRWLGWPTLTPLLDDVAVVGTREITDPKKRFPNATDYRGKLSLMETGGLIHNAEIFIGNEGGIAHYAAALGIKTYIIFGCTDPVKCMPPRNAIAISKNLGCQPCHFKRMQQRGSVVWGCANRQCLSSLTAKDIMRVIEAI